VLAVDALFHCVLEPDDAALSLLSRGQGDFMNVHAVKGDVTVLTVTGDLAAHTIDELHSARIAFKDHPSAGVVLDLCGIGILSSIGIREIIFFHQDCVAAGAALVVCNLPQKAAHILKITSLQDVLTIVDTQEDAMAILNQARSTPKDEG